MQPGLPLMLIVKYGGDKWRKELLSIKEPALDELSDSLPS